MNALLPKADVQSFVAELDEQAGASAPLAVAQIDLDDFARINDEHGHAAGDRVLASWERTLRGSLPEEAIVRRIGGDEYVVGLPDHTAEAALIVLKEIRDHFSARPATDDGTRCDVSIGIASRPPHATGTFELLQAAYTALARAKREGRGRVAIYVEERMVLKSNYYSRADLDRLAKLSDHTGRTEASLLREAVTDLFTKYRDAM